MYAPFAAAPRRTVRTFASHMEAERFRGSLDRAGTRPDVPAVELTPDGWAVTLPVEAEPLMTREEFDRAHKPARCFHRYDGQARADLAASHRSGHRQRVSAGEFYYVHPLFRDRAYPTAKRAREAAWARYVESFDLPEGEGGEAPAAAPVSAGRVAVAGGVR